MGEAAHLRFGRGPGEHHPRDVGAVVERGAAARNDAGALIQIVELRGYAAAQHQRQCDDDPPHLHTPL
jgi:hypothetical protein